MTNQTTPPDEFIAEALRLGNYQATPEAVAIVKQQWKRRDDLLLALAATLHKLALVEAELNRLKSASA